MKKNKWCKICGGTGTIYHKVLSEPSRQDYFTPCKCIKKVLEKKITKQLTGRHNNVEEKIVPLKYRMEMEQSDFSGACGTNDR